MSGRGAINCKPGFYWTGFAFSGGCPSARMARGRIAVDIPVMDLSKARIRLNLEDGSAVVDLHGATATLAGGEKVDFSLDGRTSCSSSMVSAGGRYFTSGYKSNIYLNLPDLKVQSVDFTLTVERNNWFLEST